MATLITDLDELLVEPEDNDYLVIRDTGEVFDKKVKKSVLLQSINDTLDTLGTAATEDIQVSATDATVGAVLINGAHGLGGNVPVVSGDLDSLNVTGWRYADASATNKPSSSNGFVITQVLTTNTKAQVFVTNETTPQLYFRTRVTGSWGAWNKSYNTGNTASKSEAEAGSVNDKPSTPLRVREFAQAWGIADFNGRSLVSTDLDTVINGGLYACTSTINSPTAGDGALLVVPRNGTMTIQIFGPASSSEPASSAIYMRKQNSGVWTPWRTILHDGLIASIAEAEGGTSNTKVMTPLRTSDYVGQFGIGVANSTGTFAALDDVTKGGVYFFPNTDPDAPSAGNSFSTVYAPSNTDQFATYFHGAYNAANSFFAQIKRNGVLDPARELFHDGNVASQAEAEAGVVNNKPSTPLRVKQYVDQFGLGIDVSESLTTFPGFTTSKSIGWYYSPTIESHAGAPAGATGAYVVRVDRYNHYTLYQNASSGGKIFQGVSTSATTAPPSWKEIFHSGNIASQAEAEAGVDNTTPMTPLRTHQAFNNFGLGTNDLGGSAGVAFDDILDSATYAVDLSASTGTLPPVSGFGTLQVFAGVSGVASEQIFFHRASPYDVYYRIYTAGAWQPWTKIFMGSNVASQSEAIAGTINDKPMTPLRTTEVIENLGLGDGTDSYSGNLDDIASTRIDRLATGVTTGGTPPFSLVNGDVAFTFHWDSNSSIQFVYRRDNGSGTRVILRSKHNGVWQPWYEEVTTNNVVSTLNTLTGSATPRFSHLALVDGSAGLLMDGDPGADFDERSGGSISRITNNDGGGNFNIRRNNYFDPVDLEEQYVTNDGAAAIKLSSDGTDGRIVLQVFPQGIAGDPLPGAHTLDLSYSTGTITWRGAELFDRGDIASQAEAEAGIDNDTVMTPLRTQQAIEAGSTLKANTLGYIINSPISVYEGDNFAFGAEVTGEAIRGRFKPDGTKFYLFHLDAGVAREVLQYSLSTPWDITTMSYDSVSFDVTTNSPSGVSVDFKPDGTKMYIVDVGGDEIDQYSLSPAWDITSATYDSVSASVSAQETSVQEVYFRPDGTEFFILGISNSTVYRYTLSTAWDLSTAAYASDSFSVINEVPAPRGLTFSPDGRSFVAAQPNFVYKYNLNTPWDLSTAYLSDETYSHQNIDFGLNGILFKDDGGRMYVLCVTSNTFYQINSSFVRSPL